jgi:hypothetical protein
VTAALARHLPRLLPRAEPRHATLPAAGAALDAVAEGGVVIGPSVTARLADSIPPPSFFRT